MWRGWWHADLGNLCGPYSRAYGMDLHAYVSGLALALWCADLPAPLPDLGAPGGPARPRPVRRADAPARAACGCPLAARSAFERFGGEHVVEQVVDDDPRRVRHRVARRRT